jgi:hypothetical protein
MEPVIVKQEGLSSSFISTLMSTRTLSWPALDKSLPPTSTNVRTSSMTVLLTVQTYRRRGTWGYESVDSHQSQQGSSGNRAGARNPRTCRLRILRTAMCFFCLFECRREMLGGRRGVACESRVCSIVEFRHDVIICTP